MALCYGIGWLGAAGAGGCMDRIDRIRAFNRGYTQRLGLLERSYLDSGFTLTEVRVLYELASGGEITARGLARGFGLDEGYLSRLLKRFRAKGWLARRPDPADGRQALLSLTPAGMAVFRPLQDRSRAAVGEMIHGLDEAAQEALCGALERAGGLLGEARAPVDLRDLEIGDAGWIIARHGELYARDEGYDAQLRGAGGRDSGGLYPHPRPVLRAGMDRLARGREGGLHLLRARGGRGGQAPTVSS